MDALLCSKPCGLLSAAGKWRLPLHSACKCLFQGGAVRLCRSAASLCTRRWHFAGTTVLASASTMEGQFVADAIVLASVSGQVGILLMRVLASAERGEHAYAHPLDGDGYVCAFSFNADGRVHFRSRFVRTRCVPRLHQSRRSFAVHCFFQCKV